ncbi:rho/rac/cdc gtpase-activating protein [Anaeramoeba flamelloides]|uniref:Rho/rac/cdc gtpase-activating protein n=1 Tax=Anaeramoeba flamelloides TaxID=1746091 RepID=A0AAV7Z0B5_9EUKA|nr:rho/rac/cdc gtpase-activating protein [Anaeramoeba flamelloides]
MENNKIYQVIFPYKGQESGEITLKVGDLVIIQQTDFKNPLRCIGNILDSLVIGSFPRSCVDEIEENCEHPKFPPTLLVGILKKKPLKMSAIWKTRFCKLYPNHLCWFKKSKNNNPVGAIHLQFCEKIANENKKTKEFILKSTKKTWKFKFSSENERNTWVKKLNQQIVKIAEKKNDLIQNKKNENEKENKNKNENENENGIGSGNENENENENTNENKNENKNENENGNDNEKVKEILDESDSTILHQNQDQKQSDEEKEGWLEFLVNVDSTLFDTNNDNINNNNDNGNKNENINSNKKLNNGEPKNNTCNIMISSPLDTKTNLINISKKQNYSINPRKHSILNINLKKKKNYTETQRFGVPLEIVIERDHTPIPKIIEKSIQYLEEKALKKEGIFRISGNKSKINEYKKDFDFGFDVTFLDEESVHNVSCTLKQYLRDLPESLLTITLYDHFIGTLDMKETDLQLKILREFINQLPKINKLVLKEIIKLVIKVEKNKEKNKMNFSNLAIIFGSTLFSKRTEETVFDINTTKKETKLAEIIFTNFDSLFSLSNNNKTTDKENELSKYRNKKEKFRVIAKSNYFETTKKFAIPIEKGFLLSVIDDSDTEWWYGRRIFSNNEKIPEKNNEGFFPASMVEKIEEDDFELY